MDRKQTYLSPSCESYQIYPQGGALCESTEQDVDSFISDLQDGEDLFFGF
ncbi:MAG: hypothetical protein ACI3ZS_02350 [Candidatus Cryptobacteroides sp.]